MVNLKEPRLLIRGKEQVMMVDRGNKFYGFCDRENVNDIVQQYLTIKGIRLVPKWTRHKVINRFDNKPYYL